MELVEGEPIDEYCINNDLTIEEKLKLFRKVCFAVSICSPKFNCSQRYKTRQHFYKTGWNANKSYLILEFQSYSILQMNKLILPKSGFKLMTLEYASPEQFKGKQINIATDIYSLGVVLYELLTGNFPYKFKNSLPYEIERVICTTDPEKPSTSANSDKNKNFEQENKNENSYKNISTTNYKNFEKIKRKLSGDIDNIVLKAMQKEPERRYSTVQQFSEDIRRHLEGLPVFARKNSVGYRSKKFFERHRVGVITAFLLLLSIIIGSLGIIVQSNVAAKERDRAMLEAKKSERIKCFFAGYSGCTKS